jgi:hypothetical protein
MRNPAVIALGAGIVAVAALGAGTHWAFQPVRRPEAPQVKNGGWARNEIDRFVLARVEKEGLSPSAEAERGTILRRLSFDLTGLPPTPAETEAFIADRSPDAYEKQVERLLASPHYGEKWARHWLDLARYADSDGYEKDWARPWAWRYRNWVIDALNRNMPFDQFSIEQIAGDLLPRAAVEQRVATGFHRMTLTNREGGVDNEQFRFENAVDRASTVGTVWMGLTVGCAQCHDHKFDPISQKDFYSWYALFDNMEEVDIDAPTPGELGGWMRANGQYRAEREALLEEYNVAPLMEAWEKRLLEAAANPGKWTDWDLAWDCLLKLTSGGDGEKVIRKKPAERTQRDRDVLIDHFVKNYHFAAGQKAYRELKLNELDQKLADLKMKYPQLTQAYAVEESPSPRPAHVRVRGNYKALGIAVEPGVPSSLPPLKARGRKATRLDAARWLFERDHPLTSRVTVNRMWQELFGQGIVRTSEDFGRQGEPPSHPELLDWLAAEFMDSGWDMKHMLRLMVTSAAYRQRSDVTETLRQKDPNNALLARQSRLRLPAELVRDAALAASGLLSTRIGGPSVRPPQPAGVAELAYANSVKWVETGGVERYRRGLYIHFQRATPYPLLVNFDAPKGNVTQCRRNRSNTALQALNLLNDPVFVEAAQGLAARVVNETASPQERVRRMYLLALTREPEAAESARLLKYVAEQQAIFEREKGSAEKVFALAPQAAAWVGAASVVLNLEEFITRE